MRVFSLVRTNFDLVPLEVELTLAPGLPQIQFLGLPDAVIRESVLRIKSAIRAQGFHLPTSQQVIVHLKPSHLKKTSHGLDLAVAAALLWEMGQLAAPDNLDRLILYGELTLNGQVQAPDDLADFIPQTDNLHIMTGPSEMLSATPILQVRNLRDLLQPLIKQSTHHGLKLQRPEASDLLLTQEQAQILSIIATGEHSTLLAGPSGSGKSTAAEHVIELLAEPDSELFAQSRKINRSFGQDISWRPLVNPHHTITPLAMIGGSSQILPGEITRAHGGLLIMDEFLEFHRTVHEALREPLESGMVSIARNGHWRQFPAQFLLVATTNLCPCSQFIPGLANHKCRCFNHRRMRYLARLSGPILDRFQITAFTQDWFEPASVHLQEVLFRVRQAQLFAQQTRGQKLPNSRCTGEFESEASAFAKKNLLPERMNSRRRQKACIQVARTIADLDQSEHIRPQHWEASAKLTIYPFDELKRAAQ